MEFQNKRASTGVGRRLTRILMASLAVPAFALVAGAAQAAPAKKLAHKAHHAKLHAATGQLPSVKAELAPPAPHTRLHFDWRAVPSPIPGAAYNPDNFMTGDFTGWRTRLHDRGVDFRFDLLTEAGANIGGGRANGSAYAQQLGAGFTVDTVRAFGLSNGGFFGFYMEDRAGSPLSYYTQGAPNASSNAIEPMQVYGHGENFRLSQMWYDQPLLDDKASLRVGFAPYGNEFGTSAVYYAFIANMFDAHMQSFPTDSKGWTDGPRGQWMARFKVTPTDNFYAMAAVTTIQPQLTMTTHGWDLGLENSKGYNIPVEAGYLWNISDPAALDGSFKLGGYFDSAHGTFVRLYTGAQLPDYQYGGYALVEQQLIRTNGTGSQGLRVFAEVMEGDHTSAMVKSEVIGGFTWKGTFAGRTNDTISLAVAHDWLNNSWVAYKQASLGPSVRVENNLTLIEVNYGIQMTPWLNFKPYFQYQTNPGSLYASAAQERYGNSKVVGFETKWQF